MADCLRKTLLSLSTRRCDLRWNGAMEWGGWMKLRINLSALHESSCSEFCNTSYAKQSIDKTTFVHFRCGTTSPQAVISHALAWLHSPGCLL